jgi:hypothetical protein
MKKRDKSNYIKPPKRRRKTGTPQLIPGSFEYERILDQIYIEGGKQVRKLLSIRHKGICK